MKLMKTVIPKVKFGNGNKLNSIFKNIFFVNLLIINYVVSTVDNYFNLSQVVLKNNLN